MAAIWPTFVSGLTAYLQSNSAKNENDTAKKIAQLYHASVQTAMPTLVQGATPIGLAPGPIESGFSASFKLAKSLGKVPATPATFMPAAAGIVTYWTGKTFNPAIPPPGGAPGGVNIVVFPGVPPAPQIFSAFKSMAAPAVASALAGAFTTHLLSVTGTWTGVTTTVPPVPLVLPWVGLA